MTDPAAIAGVGRTPLSRSSGVSVLALAVDASLAAIEDAGIGVAELDGIATFHENDTVSPTELADTLGTGLITWNLEWLAGGAVSCAIVAEAAKAIAASDASAVLVYRAMNGASGVRMGSFGAGELGGRSAFTGPYGFATPVQWFAMACRRYMHECGVAPEHLGHVAVRQRAYANENPRAVMHDRTLTLDEYMASPYVAEPLRLLDCCQETDGAVALVLTSEARARGLRRPPVRIAAAAYAMAPFNSLPLEKYEDWSSMYSKWLAPQLFARAEMSPEDIDLACIYDAFSFAVLCQLEDFGFCGKGEAGELVRSGALPVNPHGGLLSEGYVHGLNGVAEAVDQLRGDAGTRQLAGARAALVSGYGFSRGSALILAAT